MLSIVISIVSYAFLSCPELLYYITFISFQLQTPKIIYKNILFICCLNTRNTTRSVSNTLFLNNNIF